MCWMPNQTTYHNVRDFPDIIIENGTNYSSAETISLTFYALKSYSNKTLEGRFISKVKKTIRNDKSLQNHEKIIHQGIL